MKKGKRCRGEKLAQIDKGKCVIEMLCMVPNFHSTCPKNPGLAAQAS
jgi:hypothetical protein